MLFTIIFINFIGHIHFCICLHAKVRNTTVKKKEEEETVNYTEVLRQFLPSTLLVSVKSAAICNVFTLVFIYCLLDTLIFYLCACEGAEYNGENRRRRKKRSTTQKSWDSSSRPLYWSAMRGRRKGRSDWPGPGSSRSRNRRQKNHQVSWNVIVMMIIISGGRYLVWMWVDYRQ